LAKTYQSQFYDNYEKELELVKKNVIGRISEIRIFCSARR